jgi:hypothetical protein
MKTMRWLESPEILRWTTLIGHGDTFSSDFI